MGTLIQVCWRPVYGYLRLRWHQEQADAEDLTQEFVLRALEGNFFERYDPSPTIFSRETRSRRG